MVVTTLCFVINENASSRFPCPFSVPEKKEMSSCVSQITCRRRGTWGEQPRRLGVPTHRGDGAGSC